MKKTLIVASALSVACLCGCDNLFDNVAKSKASEVGPAAGTYIHMQDAYIVDKGKPGTFNDIDYVPPASSYFDYSDLRPGFKATAKIDLGKCPKGSTWTVKIVKVSDFEATYSATVSNEACEALTPNFKQIGQK